MSNPTDYSKYFSGHKNKDDSQAIFCPNKKGKMQKENKNSYNKVPQISDDNASNLSSIPSYPSIPEGKTEPHYQPRQHYNYKPQQQQSNPIINVQQNEEDYVPDFTCQLIKHNPTASQILRNVLTNVNSGHVPNQPQINPNNLMPILLRVGFIYMDGPSGKQLIFKKSDKSEVKRVIRILDNQSSNYRRTFFHQFYNNHNNNYNNNNNYMNNGSRYNGSISDWSSSLSSSSFALSHYSSFEPKNKNKNSNNGYQESQRGHNHGPNSTCYSGYSSIGADESHISAIRHHVLHIKGPIESSIDKDGRKEWILFTHEAGNGSGWSGTNGTYYTTQCGSKVKIAMTLHSTTKIECLEEVACVIRIPNTNGNNNNNMLIINFLFMFIIFIYFIIYIESIMGYGL